MNAACVLYTCLMATSMSSVTAITATSRVGMHASLQMETKLASNPIRKVVNLLNKMLASNKELCDENNKLCEDKICACKKKVADQQKIVDWYAGELPVLEQEYKELYAEIHGLKLDLKKKKAELPELKERLAEIVALHEKEYAEELKILAGYKTNIEAIEKAIVALNRGLTGTSTGNDQEYESNETAAFLQSKTAGLLRSIVSATMSSKISDTNRDALQAYLAQGTADETDEQSPQTDEVIGILKQMKETMSNDHREMNKAYMRKTAAYQAEKRALEKQIAELEKFIYEGTYRLGVALERLAELDAQIRDILGGGYLREKALLDELMKACSDEEAACHKQKLMCAQEAHALTEAIALLNSDEALTLFKRTLPGGASFLQMEISSKQLLKRAHEALNANRRALKRRRRDYRVDVISLAMQGKKVDFSEVIQMIDELVGILKQEEEDDYEKKAHCEKSLGEAHFKKLFLDKKMEPIKAELAELEDELKRIEDDIKAMTDALVKMNEMVDKEKERRAKEHSYYLRELAANNGAMDLLKVAKSRLTNFYGSYIQVKPQNAGKVLDMMDDIMHDLQMHMDANQDAEKRAQQDHEDLIRDSQAAREEKLEMLMTLRNEEDAAEQKIADFKQEYRQLFAEEVLLLKTIADLHKTCDWLVANFDERIAARQSEIESLRNAKTVLQGGAAP